VANSQAAQRGIKPGDIVISINGKSIKTNEDVIPFMNGTEKIETIEVKHE
jgi:S1-C subfamily serine protease